MSPSSEDTPRPTKTLRTSSGSTRLSAGGSSKSSESSASNAPTSVQAPATATLPEPMGAPSSSPLMDSDSSFHEGGEQGVRATSGGVKMTGSSNRKGPRTVRLTVSKIESWSVMKMAFLLSVAIGIATVVAFFVLWLVLNLTGVMDSMNATLTELAGPESAERVIGLFSLGRVLSVGVILAVVNIILTTALTTLFSIIYNIGSGMVGGFKLTLNDH